MSAYPPVSYAARDGRFGVGKRIGVQYFNDFLTSSRVDEGADALGEWTISATNSTEPTTTTDAPGGHVVLTNATADADMLQFQLNTESVKLGLGARADVAIRFKGNVASASAWCFGLAIKDTTLIAGASDVLLIRKDDTDTNIDFSYGINVSGSARANETSAIIASSGFAASTWETLHIGIEMDPTTVGSGLVQIWRGDEPSGKAFSLLYDNRIASGLPYDEDLTLSFGMLNGVGGDTVMTVDWVALYADITRVTT